MRRTISRLRKILDSRNQISDPSDDRATPQKTLGTPAKPEPTTTTPASAAERAESALSPESDRATESGVEIPSTQPAPVMAATQTTPGSTSQITEPAVTQSPTVSGLSGDEEVTSAQSLDTTQYLKNPKIWIAPFVIAYAFLILRTAWISDDAAISLRTVLNFVHGYGPVFNVGERVQAYTHPLWFLIISAATKIIGDVFYATFITCVVTSVTALSLLLYRFSNTAFRTGAITAMAVSSKAFVDYSTSGLENPLTHLLIVIATILAIDHIDGGKDRLTLFGLSCAAIYLNRPDTLLIVLPLALYIFFGIYKEWKVWLKALGIAAAPVLSWILFSLIYYGAPFPNTAYAKLGAGIGGGERRLQGFNYVMHTLNYDPATFIVIGSAVAAALVGRRSTKAIAIGIVTYIGYVISIGGDFMEGRFFTAIFIASLVIIARDFRLNSALVAVLVPTLLASTMNFEATFLSGADYTNREVTEYGIADERGWYFQDTSYLEARARKGYTTPEWVANDRYVEPICALLGFTSIGAGPSVHFVDTCALSDPLLARLPAEEIHKWRIAHHYRHIPDGYLETQRTGINTIADPELAEFWDKIHLITSGPIFSFERFKAILSVNLTSSPSDWDRYRTPNALPPEMQAPQETQILGENLMGDIKDTGVAWNDPRNYTFAHEIIVELDSAKTVRIIDLSLDHNDFYAIEGLVNGEWVLLAETQPQDNPGLFRHQITLDEPVEGVTQIKIRALEGDGAYSLGHLVVSS